MVSLFLLSFFSKAGVNIFAGLSYIGAFFLLWRVGVAPVTSQPWWYLLLIPGLVGIATSTLTQNGGIEELAQFLMRYKFFLLPLVIVVIAQTEKSIHGLFLAALISSLATIFYGLSQSDITSIGVFQSPLFILRYADMLMVVALAVIVCMSDEKFRKAYKNWFWVLCISLALILWALYLSGARGAWLGFFIGAVALGILFYRPLLYVMLLGFMAVLLFASDTKFVKEIYSIADMETDISNNARLQLWQLGWEFSYNHFWFGAGRIDMKQRYMQHYESLPAQKKEKYELAKNYPGDMHNSYLQLFVEWGALFFVVFTVCGAAVFYFLYRSLGQAPPRFKYLPKMAIVASFGFLAAQLFHTDLYSYGAINYLLVLAAGLSATQLERA